MSGPLPPDYHVDFTGRVFSDTGWRGYGFRELVQQPNSHGYLSVRVSFPDGKRKRLLVHTLVAAYHLPPRPSPQHEVCHIDGDKTNNRKDNLRWGTRKDNAADRERHGRTSRGATHSIAIRSGKADSLTDAERTSILRLSQKGWSQRSIADRLGRSQFAIRAAIRQATEGDAHGQE